MARRGSQFKVTIAGPDLEPAALDMTELADLIRDLSKLLSTDGTRVSITSLRRGSIVIPVQSSDPRTTGHAINNTQALIYGDADAQELSTEGREAFGRITKFCERREAVMEVSSTHQKETNLRITKQVELPRPITTRPRGETSLYGYLEQVGGREPKIRLVLTDGSRVYCSASRDIVEQLGNRVYKWIGVRGKATWNPHSGVVEAFEIHNVLPYERGTVGEAFAHLRDAVGDAFDGVDAVEYVRNARDE